MERYHGMSRGDLSIHDLTRRSTMLSDQQPKPKDFQFTTSQGGRQQKLCQACLKWIFQFTTSQGGRQCWSPVFLPPGKLSIHDLTRRSTRYRNRKYYKIRSFNSRPHKEVDEVLEGEGRGTAYFQFTTSQGGRLESYNHAIGEKAFQFTTSQGGRPFHYS